MAYKNSESTHLPGDDTIVIMHYHLQHLLHKGRQKVGTIIPSQASHACIWYDLPTDTLLTVIFGYLMENTPPIWLVALQKI